MITTSVIAVTRRRVVQPKRRPTHHSIAQHIKTGTMMLSCNRLLHPARRKAASSKQIQGSRLFYPDLPDESDADRISAAPDHLTVTSRPRVACKCQPQRVGQRACLIGRDPGTRTRDVLHHAGARGEAAVKRDPARLA